MATDPHFDRLAAAQDLRTLAWLHAQERDAPTWRALHAAGLPNGLTLLPAGDPALQALDQALAALAAEDSAHASDRLAADYAAIYLTHALRASPCESVWRDDDHLLMQGPTFAVRALYQQHGLKAPDWRAMPDDHLTHELSFVAHLLETGHDAQAAQFLDQHLLTWLPEFGARVAQRADSAVYAALAVLTVDACRALRGHLPAPIPKDLPADIPGFTPAPATLAAKADHKSCAAGGQAG